MVLYRLHNLIGIHTSSQSNVLGIACILGLGCFYAVSSFSQSSSYEAQITYGSFEAGAAVTRSLPTGVFSNPSFESGDLTGWITSDISSPFVDLQAASGGVDPGFGLFTSAPSDGGFSAFHGFDGVGPDTITLSQDVTLPLDAVYLKFDYRAGWNLLNYGAAQDRVFSVILEPTGGGAPYDAFEIVRAPFGEFKNDIGPRTGEVNVQTYGGQSVRVTFHWDVPENSTGPGFFEFDNVRLEGNTLYSGELGSGFGTLDKVTGAFTSLGASGTTIDSMAYDPGTDTVYGVQDNPHELVVIDQQSGDLTVVGPLSVPYIDGLAFDSNANILYGARNSGVLYEIDTLTGAQSVIGNMEHSTIGGLAFDRFSNTLYASSFELEMAELLTVNTSTGLATPIHTGGEWIIQSLAFNELDQKVYGLDTFNGYTVRFDPIGGTSEVVGPTGTAAGFNGMASKTPIPTTIYVGKDVGSTISRLSRTTHLGSPLLNTGLTVAGLAHNPLTGITYMTTASNDVYEVHQDNLLPLGNSGGPSIVGGLAYDANTNTLYASSNGRSLYELDKSNGTASLIGTADTGTFGGLAFDRFSDTLYGADDSVSPSRLVTINTSTAMAEVVGTIGFADVDGLTFCEEDGFLYAIADTTDELIRIDPSTGAGVSLGTVSDEVGNVAFSAGRFGIASVSQLPDYFVELFSASDNDLDNTRITFIPDELSVSSYRAYRESVADWSVDPARDNIMALSDDSFQTVALTGGMTVSLYGASYSSIHVGSNGYITFTASDIAWHENIDNHFTTPRVSGLFDDLLPSGNVSFKQLSDRIVVSYDGISERFSSNSNDFQIEMFFDGTIRLTYLTVAAADGLVGLSEGSGKPFNFEESDISNAKLFPPDFDGDGAPDFLELLAGTDPGVPQGESVVAGPPMGSDRDSDGDGVSDQDELYVYSTNPFELDTDGDGIGDGEELALGFDPLSSDSTPEAATWVDFAYAGNETGTFEEPFNTLAEASGVVPSGGIIRIDSNSTSETITLDQIVQLEAVGGTVRLGTL